MQTTTQHVAEPVTKTEVSVETRDLPPDEARHYEGMAGVLREGETLRVPVVEEKLQVEKEPRVTREAVIRAQPHTELEEREVELHRQVLEVDEKGDANLPDAWEWTERRY